MNRETRLALAQPLVRRGLWWAWLGGGLVWSAVVEAPRAIEQAIGLAGPGVPAVLGWAAVGAGLVARRMQATPRAGALAALGPLAVSGWAPSPLIVMAALVLAGLAGGWVIGAVVGRGERTAPDGAAAGLNLVAAAGGLVLVPLSPLWTAALAAVVVTFGLSDVADQPPSLGRAVPVADPSSVMEAAGLTLSFGERDVLRDVHIRLRPGELVALVGANGSGKSTLLRVLSGQVLPDAGSLWLDGQDAIGASPEELARHGVALASGARPVFPDLTVRENLQVATWVTGARRSRADMVVGAIACFPELVPLTDAPAGTLSGGEQRLLALTASLLAQPRVLFADEITLGLSPLARVRALQTLRSAADAGATIVVVEHELRDLLPLANRVFVLEDGVLRETDDVTPAAARFIPREPS